MSFSRKQLTDPVARRVGTFSSREQRADGEQRPQTRKVQPSGIDQGPSQGKNRCLFCSRNHALGDCQSLRWKPYQERIQFLLSKKLCFGCLSTEHVAKFCPQRKNCKIANCKGRHPTVLYTSPRERPAVDVGVGTEDVISTQVCSHMVKTGTSANSETSGEGRRTGMAVIPVRVRAKHSDKSVITYAFLDNGSNSSFCTESLMKQLGINGQQVKISLSTLEKKNSITNSFLVRDPKLYQDYKAFMEDILSKGYARKVSPDQKSPAKGTAWYIPHHGVYHPRKPGKICVVFDCSAKFMGKSLNDMLYKGPDLTSSLVGVLLRFREERVAVMADIYRVHVPPSESSRS